MPILLAVEKSSTHPVAKAIIEELESGVQTMPAVKEQQEIPGYGVRAVADGKEVFIGSRKLMDREKIRRERFSPKRQRKHVSGLSCD